MMNWMAVHQCLASLVLIWIIPKVNLFGEGGFRYDLYDILGSFARFVLFCGMRSISRIACLYSPTYGRRMLGSSLLLLAVLVRYSIDPLEGSKG